MNSYLISNRGRYYICDLVVFWNWLPTPLKMGLDTMTSFGQ